MGKNLDFIRKLFAKEICCPSQGFSLDTGIDLQRAGPGRVLENSAGTVLSLVQGNGWKVVPAEGAGHQISFPAQESNPRNFQRETRFSNASFTHWFFKEGSADVGFLPWLWSSCRGRRIKSPKLLCIFAKKMRKKLMDFFLRVPVRLFQFCF